MKLVQPLRLMAAGILFVSTPATAAAAAEPSNVDLFLQSGANGKATGALERPDADHVAHFERRLGVPTFLWAASARTSQSLRPKGLTPEQAARRYLSAHASVYRTRPSELGEAKLSALHDTGKGVVIASFRKQIHGIPVFGDTINVAMTQALSLVALTGYLTPHTAPAGTVFPLSFEAAVARALNDLTDFSKEERQLVALGPGEGGYQRFALDARRGSTRFAEPARARKVFFGLSDRVEPAYHVELQLGAMGNSDLRAYAYVVSALDGRTLFRKNLKVSDAFSYRVWVDSGGSLVPFDGPQGDDASPHPTGTPDGYLPSFVPSHQITLPHARISTQDAWLPFGATVTTGNNADAYADLVAPSGFSSGDLRASTNGVRVFDYTYDPLLSANANSTQIQAAVTQLFYDVNFFHDWYYDQGFDERSGNAQHDNHGRGGLGNDRLRAEAQDVSGVNNANMFTPSDGASPTMQMFVFDLLSEGKVVVTSPPHLVGNRVANTATFGPVGFSRSGELVLADDGAAPAADACSPLVNSVGGRIAVIDRGGCDFVSKVQAAQDAGAIGAIIVDDVSGSQPPLLGGTSATVTIPSLSVSQADGNALKAALARQRVQSTLVRTGDRDGSIDNTIVAHEWGHFISNRLVGDAVGLTNSQGMGMGEGWADFHALMMMVKADDALRPANANFSGVYSLGTYAIGGAKDAAYFGIRRLPYSTDFTKNALTFRHISDGVPLPANVPTAFGQDGAHNSEVHNTGEVWGTMLWEAYASLLREAHRLTFEQAQERMRSYLVASYKLTPNMPTFLEARDALLAAAWANDPEDMVVIAKAFARRGAGLRAVAPDRQGNGPVVESYVSGNDLAFVDAQVDDRIRSCDGDGVLDNDERGLLTVTLRNVGTGTLSATRGTVSSTTPGITFGNSGQISFERSEPFGTTRGSVEISLTGSAERTGIELNLRFDDPALATLETITRNVSLRANFDELPNSSMADTVESVSPAWTVDHDSTLPASRRWQVMEVSPTAHLWSGPNPNERADEYLISPPLKVSPSDTFTLVFQHRYDFEASQSGIHFDGGVIELTVDDGVTWIDIGAEASPPYNATLEGHANPLHGRRGFGGRSPGYPALRQTTVDLDRAYAGRTVRLRFRIGADVAGAANGWEIDDIAFTGISNRPFTAVIADATECPNLPPIARGGPDVIADERSIVHLDGTASDDPEKRSLSFEWLQTAGPAVTLEGAATVAPHFLAPEVNAEELLTFTLVVRDGELSSAPAPVHVTVKNVSEPAKVDTPRNQRGCGCGFDDSFSLALITGVLVFWMRALQQRSR